MIFTEAHLLMGKRFCLQYSVLIVFCSRILSVALVLCTLVQPVPANNMRSRIRSIFSCLPRSCFSFSCIFLLEGMAVPQHNYRIPRTYISCRLHHTKLQHRIRLTAL